MINKILIGCVPRSGSTLFSRLLNKFNCVIITPESGFKKDIIDYKLNKINKHELVNKLSCCNKFLAWGVSFNEINFDESVDEIFNKLILSYAKNHNIKLTDEIFWIDHTPENLQHIHIYVEHLKINGIINLVRDPRAVISSLLKVKWSYDDIYNLSYFYRDTYLTNFFSYSHFKDKKIIVQYEELCNKNDLCLLNICEYFSINQTLKLNSNISLPEYTKKQHELVNKPIDLSRVDSWKTILTKYELNTINSILGDILTLDYNEYNNISFKYRSLKKMILKRIRSVIKV